MKLQEGQKMISVSLYIYMSARAQARRHAETEMRRRGEQQKVCFLILAAFLSLAAGWTSTPVGGKTRLWASLVGRWDAASTREPVVPAQRWPGHRWVFWQELNQYCSSTAIRKKQIFWHLAQAGGPTFLSQPGTSLQGPSLSPRDTLDLFLSVFWRSKTHCLLFGNSCLLGDFITCG